MDTTPLHSDAEALADRREKRFETTAAILLAILAAILFTVHFGARLLIRLIEPQEVAGH